jgi:acyl carrier protein
VSKQPTDQVIALIAGELGIPARRLNDGSSIDNVPEWDSEAHLNICMAFEERFNVGLDMETIGEVTSVHALAALLDKG